MTSYFTMAVSSTINLFLVSLCLVQGSHVLELQNVSFSFENYKNLNKEIEQFNIGNLKCWRYCIKQSLGKLKNNTFLNLLWEFDKNSYNTDLNGETVLVPKIFTDGLLNSTDEYTSGKCKKFLMLGCDIPETRTNILAQKETLLKNIYPTDKNVNIKSKAPKKFDILIKTNSADGSIESRFRVESIEIVVAGNITKIGMQLPIDNYGNESKEHNQRENLEKLKAIPSAFQKIRTQKRETEYDPYDDNHDRAHVRFEDEVPERNPLQDDIEYIPRDTKHDVDILGSVNRSTVLAEAIEPRLIEPLEIDDLQNADFDSNWKYILLDVASEANLVLDQNYNHMVTFELTNNYPFPIRFTPRSFSSDFYVAPFYVTWYQVAAKQKIPINVNVQPQPGQNRDFGTVTLSIDITFPVKMTTQKTTYLFLRRPVNNYQDNSQSEIKYYFNNNCNGNLKSEWCSKTWWSVNVEVEDYYSGLKSVVSTPRGIYATSDYTSGTKTLQKFYYTNSCCNPVVEVKAVSVNGNVRTKVIDVREWTNLSGGEIAAIVLGVLLIIILIALIVVSILYCLHRRKSLELPYTQRYSTRATPRTE